MKSLRVLLVLCLIFMVVAITWSSSGTMSVQVKEGQLRSTPSFLAPIIGKVTYGDQVETVQQQGDWLDVKNTRSQRGWIHQSALTTKRVVLSSGGGTAPVAASGHEVALAGKGFNAEVESKYSQTHKDADYSAVNRIERMTASPQEMMSFLKEGGLKLIEGGVK